MSPENKLQQRVAAAAQAALAEQGTVSAIDVLFGLGWLVPSTLERWQRGELSSLEQGLQPNPARIAEAMRHFSAWAAEQRLEASETAYVAKTPARPVLRFSLSGDPELERVYRTHWLSRDLPAKKREKLVKDASRPPELVVIEPLDEWKCHRCGGTGDLLIMEQPGPSCLPCAGLGTLEYLPAGDAGLSRRAKAKSKVHAVVVRFSRSRKRYERQGLMVERQALKEARAELAEL